MILVFAGAGASAAVDQNQYPTTVEFFKRLPSEITSKTWFSAVSKFLDEQEPGRTIDIEQILGTLREMQEFCVKTFDTRTISGWMLLPGKDRLRNIDRENRGNLEGGHLRVLVEIMKADDASLRLLQDDINALVYDFYAIHPNETKLECWKRLLTKTMQAPQIVELFTTNYDIVLERVIIDAGLENEIASGRVSDGLGSWLDLSNWAPPAEPLDLENHQGLLTKLHGSVDWQRGSNGKIVTGCEGFTGNHRKHLALYPGHKGEPREEPYMAFHNRLRLIVESADAAIFVGYSFRDEYINQILSDLSPGVPKYVITKDQPNEQVQETLDPAFLSDAERVRAGFTRESVNSCLDFLRQHHLID